MGQSFLQRLQNGLEEDIDGVFVEEHQLCARNTTVETELENFSTLDDIAYDPGQRIPTERPEVDLTELVDDLEDAS